MCEELEKKYGKYTNYIEIAYTDSDTKERGVFATRDIQIGDIIIKMPMTEILQGTHIELTKQLEHLDNEYTRSFPSDLTNFPILWSPSQIESLNGSAMKDMIPSRKETLQKEMETENSLVLRNRLLVGSRGFTLNKDTILMVPYADMMNHSNEENIIWEVKKEMFIMKALRNIPKGNQLYDSYGTKTNYENLLFYGMVLKNNIKQDVTYEVINIPSGFRKNINYSYLKDSIEFELCGSYSRGTIEIFSLLRFLICANSDESECPQTLNGFDCTPISIRNELIVNQLLYNCLCEIYNVKIKRLKNARGKVSDFAQTEIDCIMYWLNVLPKYVKVYQQTKQKEAKKLLNKLDHSEYIQKVMRPMISKKSSYKSIK